MSSLWDGCKLGNILEDMPMFRENAFFNLGTPPFDADLAKFLPANDLPPYLLLKNPYLSNQTQKTMRTFIAFHFLLYLTVSGISQTKQNPVMHLVQ
ncbi:MAG: hypothetical protein JJU34_10545 [Lunatimonas sp.]|uniref:hypothetical protein n=1 Tax=Lunatimonas sp. TaxID=2060141 RepID=UPI00263BE4C7|nr:hypothetical protein [Lunatimonas sp.]MCC5937712.1 hypothetical protein [Lunatimonas sp.]